MTKSFNNVFDTVFNSLEKSRLRQSIKSESFSLEDSSESLMANNNEIMEEYNLQNLIRPWFGKKSINTAPIGTHPDMHHLGSNLDSIEYSYICTLFVDIKGSTRLSLLYDAYDVFKFKNAVIKTCVEVVRSLDGYVHRIMGDAVMAFFGSKSICKEDAIANALNCCVTLKAVLEESVKPWMNKKGYKIEDFGFRIGCDFGDDKDVLWGAFGYESVKEISALGLQVDMASKLQGLADKNGIMLGQTLIDYIDLPSTFTKIKTKSKGGIDVKVDCVKPNYTLKDGKSLSYKMRLIRYDKFLSFVPLPGELREKVVGTTTKIHSNHIHFFCMVIDEKTGNEDEYISGSRFLDKKLKLLFKVSAVIDNFHFPLKGRLTKTNYGKETPEDERGISNICKNFILNKATSKMYVNNGIQHALYESDEGTSYRGLHTMQCSIIDAKGKPVFNDTIGVYIK